MSAASKIKLNGNAILPTANFCPFIILICVDFAIEIVATSLRAVV
jgi:hypothetical protein